MKRFTLLDFTADKKNLVEWLNAGRDPIMVSVRTSSPSSPYWRGVATYEQKPLDENTVDAWFADYRHQLALDWSTSKLNKHKQLTWRQFHGECLKAVGIKSIGTVAERIERAIIMRPDLYKSAAEIAAAQKAEHDAQRAANKARLAELDAERETAETQAA